MKKIIAIILATLLLAGCGGPTFREATETEQGLQSENIKLKKEIEELETANEELTARVAELESALSEKEKELEDLQANFDNLFGIFLQSEAEKVVGETLEETTMYSLPDGGFVMDTAEDTSATLYITEGDLYDAVTAEIGETKEIIVQCGEDKTTGRTHLGLYVTVPTNEPEDIVRAAYVLGTGEVAKECGIISVSAEDTENVGLILLFRDDNGEWITTCGSETLEPEYFENEFFATHDLSVMID